MPVAEAVSLVVLYMGAFLVPLTAGRVKIPAAVGEILFGVIVGPSLLGWIHHSEPTEFLAELGFIFLMFLVGMEIDFNRIERESLWTVCLAGAVAIMVLISAVWVAHRMGYSVFMGLILGAMSVGILMVALTEVGATDQRWGQLILLVGSIGEFLTLISLTGYDLIYAFGFGLELLIEGAKVASLFFVAYLVLSALRLVVWWFPKSFERWVDEEDPSEIGVRFGFVLMLSLSAIAAWAGIEAILGAFLAGILFTYVFRETGVLETKLLALGQGFFVPIFFINVGVSFNLGALGNLGTAVETVALLAAASLAVKVVPSLLLLLAGLSARAAIAGSFLLATPLTLLVAAAALGLQIGVIDEPTSSAIVLLAIVTGVVFPTVFKILCPPVEAPLEPQPKKRGLHDHIAKALST